ncbi:MAG: GntR family transcriptional regulator [Deinococcota bacterium]
MIQAKDTLQHDTLLTRVTNRLRKLILTNQIKAGERLKQDDIARLLGVSRTPVREAIRQLETEGLITTLPYKGAVVTRVSEEELEDIYQIRIALEARATRLACHNMTPKDIEVLEQIVANMHLESTEGRAEQSLQVNRQFYQYLFSLSNRPQLFELTMNYLDKANRFRQQFFYDESQQQHTVQVHVTLIALFRKNNIDDIVAYTSQQLHYSLAEIKQICVSATS